uniref:GATA-type domain-containing protein n=2 Tax=Kalanchoe fedtschenkoi TaxID=63787 RepID=A0A7N0T726_KALFE
MSVSPSSDGPKKEVPDYIGFFTHELEDLMSGADVAGDDFFPLLGFKSDAAGRQMRGDDANESREGGGGLKKSGSLFCDGLGGELSNYKKEKLKGLLKQSVSIFTQEVDQMVEVVLATCQLQHRLRSKGTASSSQDSASGNNERARSSEKMKRGKFTSPKTSDAPAPVRPPANIESVEEGYLERPRKFRSMIDILSQNGQSCAHCNTTQAPMWRKTPSGARICDFCGLRLRKRGMQLSPQKKDQTITGSVQEADNKDEEVTDDLKFLLGNDRLQVEQTMKKYADEISASLGLLEQQLEGFLDNVTSKCRSMTFFEKQSLWSLIKDLPPENFDRVVEIIKRSRGLDQRDENDILVDLEDTDNAVLWRLYYYAKAVENARNLVG